MSDSSLPPRPETKGRKAEPASLLNEVTASTQSELRVPVTVADARAAVWLSHKWTRRMVFGGGGTLISLLVVLAGMWGDAVLDSFNGLRSDFASYTERMDARWTKSDKRQSELAQESALANQRLTATEARLGKLEAKVEGYIYKRYGEAQRNYEKRHGLQPDTVPDSEAKEAEAAPGR